MTHDGNNLTAGHSEGSLVESHSYDYIPEDQRHGSARKQLPFWFMLNATLITLFTGAIGPTFTLGLAWTIVAIVGGSVFGTFFQAFHAAQGPSMGLPQMIQSRVQFGSRGSVLPLAAVVVVTLGFGIFYIQLAAQSLVQVAGPHLTTFDWVVAAVGTAIAIVGHNLLHKVERWLSLVVVANLVLLTVAVFVELPVGHLLTSGGFVLTGFIAQFGASASYQIAIAPIVSDYTRYLPANTKTSSMVAVVFGGTLGSAVWLESLGAVIAAAKPGGDLVADIASVGNDLGFRLGTVTLALTVLVTTSIFSVSLYSATVTALSTVEAFRYFRSTVALRAVCLCLAGGLTLAGSLLLSSDFLANFSGFLSVMLYLLIPWTAVNLVDFYFVRKGTYSITDILEPDGGIYGHWNRKGMAAYVVGFVAMVPFFSTVIFTGPVAAALDGADIAPVVGLAVSAGAYLIFMRRNDLAEEMAIVATRSTTSAPSRRELSVPEGPGRATPAVDG